MIVVMLALLLAALMIRHVHRHGTAIGLLLMGGLVFGLEYLVALLR